MNHQNIHFWLRKSDKQKKLTEADLQHEKIAIYCRIRVNNTLPAEISTGEKIEPTRWINQRVDAISKSDNLINDRLDNIRNQVKHVFNKLEEAGEHITSVLVKDTYSSKPSRAAKAPTLLSIFDAYLQDCDDLVKKDEMSDATITKKKSVRRNVALFIDDHYHKKDLLLSNMITPGKVEFAFAYDFMHWGKTKEVHYKEYDEKQEKMVKRKKIFWDHNHCSKQLGMTSHALDYAIVQGLIQRNPLYKKVPAPKKGAPKWLGPEEVTAIKEYKFETDVVSTLQDIFLFCCYTGLAFKEVESLKAENLTIVLDETVTSNPEFSKHWLFIQRQKTKRSSTRVCKIPLLKDAYEILQKYKDHPACNNSGRLLPVTSNKQCNEYLKNIQNLCTIKQNLTMHIARHTCSRIFLDNGFSKDFVAQMFGHSTTKYIGTVYGEITTRRMSREMEEVSKQSNVAFV